MIRFAIRIQVPVCLILIFLTITSCSSRYYISQSFIPLNPGERHSVIAKQIELVFDGENIPFQYERIGMVEVGFGRKVPAENGLSHLKYLASQKGGDALISVRKVYGSRTSRARSAKVAPFTGFSGIVVKRKPPLVKADSSNLVSVDTSYRNVVRNDLKIMEQKSNQNGVLTIVVCLLAGLTIVFLAGGGPSKAK